MAADRICGVAGYTLSRSWIYHQLQWPQHRGPYTPLRAYLSVALLLVQVGQDQGQNDYQEGHGDGHEDQVSTGHIASIESLDRSVSRAA